MGNKFLNIIQSTLKPILYSLVIIFSITNYIQVGYIKKIERALENSHDSIFWIKNAVLHQVHFSNQIIRIPYKYINDSIVITKKRRLIYRYSTNMCETCIEKDLNILRTYQDKIDFNNIILLVSFPKNRDNFIKVNSLSRDFTYLPVKEEEFPIPQGTDSIPQRFFAILSEKGTLEYIYYPSIECEFATKFYLSSILPILQMTE